uniref:Autophagy-related protein 4 n=1 Tax=Mycena chlorophos TaxID=658473 RepID=A0ABQ0LTX0_MYCCL|nr:predicted protein [Mycena chlorophos]
MRSTFAFAALFASAAFAGATTVLTPSGGERLAANTYLVPEGGSILHVDASTVHVLDSEGAVVKQVAVDASAVRPAASKTTSGPAPLKTGWITFASWLNQGSSPISSFTTSWTVPPVPKTENGQTVFLFNSIEPNSGHAILQPVLQYGGSAAGGGQYWAVASWYLVGNSTFHTKPVKVSAGKKLNGIITLLSSSGSTHDYHTAFTNVDGTALKASNAAELTWATETLEAYSIKSINDYPAGSTVFSDINLKLKNGNVPSVSWAHSDDTKDGLSTVIDTNGAKNAKITINRRRREHIGEVRTGETDCDGAGSSGTTGGNAFSKPSANKSVESHVHCAWLVGPGFSTIDFELREDCGACLGVSGEAKQRLVALPSSPPPLRGPTSAISESSQATTPSAYDTDNTMSGKRDSRPGTSSGAASGSGAANGATVKPTASQLRATASATAGKTTSTSTPQSTSTSTPIPGPSSSRQPPSQSQTQPQQPPPTATSPPPAPMSPTGTSKLPRFLQSPTQRDRSKSLSMDPPRPPSSASTSSSSAGPRRTGRFLGLGRDKDKERERERERIREAERADPSAAELLAMQDDGYDDTDMDMLQSPSSPTSFDIAMSSSPPSAYATARPRTRADRQFSASTPPGSASSHSNSSSHSHSSHYSATSPNTLHVVRSPSRLSAGGDGLTTRLSGWFSHIAGSTSDLSLTSTIGAAASLATSTSRTISSASSSRKQQSSSSSRKEGSSGSGKGGGGGGLLDKAVRYLLDGDANPDRSTAEIWLMGVRMDGWSREDEERFARTQNRNHPQSPSSKHHNHQQQQAQAQAQLDDLVPDPGPWPAAFHGAFYAQVWCTYRAGFPEPIRDLAGVEVLGAPLVFPPPSAVAPSSAAVRAPPMHSPTQSDASASSYASSSPSSSTHGHGSGHSTASSTGGGGGKRKWWPLSLGNMGSSKGWSSDAGWGCMLRTTQSLLATALMRVGAPPLQPSSAPPFPPASPTTHAAHARLLSWFADAPAAPFSVHRMALAGKKAGKDVGMWFGPSAAGVAVRTLVEGFSGCGVGVALGGDGGTVWSGDVMKASWVPGAGGSGGALGDSASLRGGATGSGKSWGGRPVLVLVGVRLGLEGVNPVYYETIKTLFTFPQSVGIAGGRPSSSYYFVGVQGDGLFYLDPHHSRPTVPLRPYLEDDSVYNSHQAQPPPPHKRTPSYSHVYGRGGSMSPERAGSMSPERDRGGSLSPELERRGGSLSPDPYRPMTEDELVYNPNPNLRRSVSPAAISFPNVHTMSPAEEAHWQRAYSLAELRTYHCERVRKMPMAGLDPSMLIGFLVRSEEEWVDLRRRIGELPRTIFAIQDDVPSWGGDDDDELDGISDPEEEPVVDVEVEGEGDDAEGDDGDVSSVSHASNWSHPPAFGKHPHTLKHAQPHTHVHSDSASTTHSKSTTGTGTSTGSSASQVDTEDTEEDAVGPITPLPGSTSSFDLSIGAGKGKGVVREDDEDEDEDDEDGFVDAASEVLDDNDPEEEPEGEGDIEDDWVDPVSTPAPVPAAPAKARAPMPVVAPPPPVKKSRSAKSTTSSSSASSSSKTKTTASAGRKSKSGSAGKKAVPVPVPVPNVHYPFPGSGEGDEGDEEDEPHFGVGERDRNITVVAPKVKTGQSRSQRRARDGGRTQSGGVRGVLTED